LRAVTGGRLTPEKRRAIKIEFVLPGGTHG
jgi:hypothetical protein